VQTTRALEHMQDSVQGERTVSRRQSVVKAVVHQVTTRLPGGVAGLYRTYPVSKNRG